MIIDELSKILTNRKNADPDSSYVAALYAGGLETIIAKVKEESNELIAAARDYKGAERDEHLIHEAADLWFHSLVLLAHLNQDSTWVLDELARRFGTSGIEEKANRD